MFISVSSHFEFSVWKYIVLTYAMMAYRTYTLFAGKMTIKEKKLWFVAFSNITGVKTQQGQCIDTNELSI